ncbi:MAG: hypothetical protein II894_01885 [Bacteroidales bacterium]|nr:hypothetical protein [Bacteroidales bacterium]
MAKLQIIPQRLSLSELQIFLQGPTLGSVAKYRKAPKSIDFLLKIRCINLDFSKIKLAYFAAAKNARY